MFPRRLKLCNLFGIPLYLDFSLVILLVLFTTGGTSFFAGIVCAVLLLVSITAHELGHSLMARYFGYRTNDITLSLLGGCASLIAMPRKASQELWTAIAGPAVSFALSFIGICGLAICAVQGGLFDAIGFVLGDTLESFGVPCTLGSGLVVPRDLMWLVQILAYLACMNAMLGCFNLLPGFPMDGGRIFRSVMRSFMPRPRATYIAMIVGRVFAVLLALSALQRMFHGGGWGFVSLLIAWMIWREGGREYQQTLIESAWGGGWDFSARVSPPPYGGDSDETEIRRHRP